MYNFQDKGANVAANVGLSLAITDFVVHLKAAGHARSTIQCYRDTLVKLSDMLGQDDMNMITGRCLDLVIIRLGSQTAGEQSRSAVTLNKIKSIYRSFFRWTYEKGYKSLNASTDINLAKAQSLPTIPITFEEIARLLSAIRLSNSVHAERDAALFSMYAFTGLRRSEVLSLKIGDYDPLALNLKLRHAKGGVKRLQPVPSILAEILERHIHCHRRNGLLCDYAPIFHGAQLHSSLSARQAQNRFDKWKRIAGIRKNLTIHSFRAGFATLLYHTTGDLLLVARALGHSNIQTTRRYVRTDMSQIRAAMERIFAMGICY